MFARIENLFVSVEEDFSVISIVFRIIVKKLYYGFSTVYLEKFENKISHILQGVKVFGVNSGTDALIDSLKIAGVRSGDEVIVPAFSYISTASAIGWVGANPIFVDIAEDDYALDPEGIEKKITSRSKAIIVAHLFGQPAVRLGKIVSIAKKHNLIVIEDAAQSFGATVDINGVQKITGTIGDFGCFSFSSTKIFSAIGSGGAVFVKNKYQYNDMNAIRFYGSWQHYYDYPIIGTNNRLHELQAAALLARIPYIHHWLSHRRELAECYIDGLQNIQDIILPISHLTTERVWYRFVIRTNFRNELLRYIIDRIGSQKYLHPTVNYPVPLPFFGAFQYLGHRRGDFPNAEKIVGEVLSLPIANNITLNDVKNITSIIHSFFKR